MSKGSCFLGQLLNYDHYIDDTFKRNPLNTVIAGYSSELLIDVRDDSCELMLAVLVVSSNGNKPLIMK